MPSFEVDFEVFCDCGAGLCQQSSGRNSHRRGHPQVVVEPCEYCLEKLRNDMQAEIDELKEQLEAFENQPIT